MKGQYSSILTSSRGIMSVRINPKQDFMRLKYLYKQQEQKKEENRSEK